MTLPYTSEILQSPDGTECAVLDVLKIDFTNAARGRKRSETLVREAKGGERIVTVKQGGLIESECVAEKGDAIFVNLHDLNDIYIPGNPDGTRWKFDELAERGYEVVATDSENGGVRVKTAAVFKLLHEAVKKPTCIRDAWGQGNHQFLFPGATLKLNEKDGNRVTGINKPDFDGTWEIFGL